jgi:hypothetical protein
MNQQMNRVGSFQALEDEELPDLKGAKEVDVEIYSATKVRSPFLVAILLSVNPGQR